MVPLCISICKAVFSKKTKNPFAAFALRLKFYNWCAKRVVLHVGVLKRKTPKDVILFIYLFFAFRYIKQKKKTPLSVFELWYMFLSLGTSRSAWTIWPPGWEGRTWISWIPRRNGPPGRTRNDGKYPWVSSNIINRRFDIYQCTSFFHLIFTRPNLFYIVWKSTHFTLVYFLLPNKQSTKKNSVSSW